MGSSPSQPLGDHQGQLGGQAQWQYPGTSTMPQGHLPGYQNPLATVPDNTPMPFPPAPPMSAISPPIHVGPPIPSPLVNLHPGSELLPQGLMAQMGHTPSGLCHLGGDPHISRPPVTPTPSGEIDFKALEDRLNVAFT